MWLLNAETECLEYAASDKPEASKDSKPYAILSHRWLSDNAQEVSYSDIRPNIPGKTGLSKAWPLRHLSKPAYSKKAGYRKVNLSCKQARQDGLQYVWIDTCCINKADEAETAESIRSMYNWYRRARVCYVYLADVTADRLDASGKQTAERKAQSDWRIQFETSDWFRRGWTLQELLAPRMVNFYNADWKYLGTLEDLAHAVAEVTHIERSCLTRYVDRSGMELSDYSYAQRLSWAARRETSRGEDRTYSLMGVFGVHMPVLYSEGSKKAFRRLQEELFKRHADHSLLVWTGPSGGLLSTSIDYFRNSGTAFNVPSASRSSDCTLDDKQYRTFLPILPIEKLPADKAEDLRENVGATHLALLSCRYIDNVNIGPALCLNQLSRRERNDDRRFYVVGEMRRIERCPIDWFRAVKPQHISIVRGSQKRPKGLRMRLLSQAQDYGMSVDSWYPESAWSKAPHNGLDGDEASYYTFWPRASDTVWHTAAVAVRVVGDAEDAYNVVLVMKHNTQSEDTRVVHFAHCSSEGSLEALCRSFKSFALPFPPDLSSLELAVSRTLGMKVSSSHGKVQVTLLGR